MCQLTYCNLQQYYLNASMVYFLSTIGSDRHDDGCGIIKSDNTIWKTKSAANKITNLGELFYSLIGDGPVPFHIRSATLGIEVTDENAHPFEGKHYILMHNGTLVPRNGEESKDKKVDSDSLRFLQALDSAKDKNPDGSFEDIFNDAMKNFAGKFAFIIRDRDTKTDYIIRGRTAELFISFVHTDGKFDGYVINTSKETILSATKQFVGVTGMFWKEKTTVSEPVLLEQESIFVAEKENIRRLGKAIEFTPIKPVNHNHENKPNNAGRIGNFLPGMGLQKATSSSKAIESAEVIKYAERIHRYLADHSMSVLDLQLLFQVTSAISLLEVTREDASAFIDYLIPKISAETNTRNKVKTLLNGRNFPLEIYRLYNLEYPWTVNKPAQVIKALEAFNKKEDALEGS